MPIPIAAAIAAGSQIVSQGINAASTASMNKKTRKWNEKMYGIQRADALADWEMQNAYNSPAAQMERLREAGLNPNLVYGNGADAQGGIVRSTDVKGWNPQAPQFDAGSVSGAYFDTLIRQQQLDNLKTQQTLMEQELNNKIANELKSYMDVSKGAATKDLLSMQLQLRGFELNNAARNQANRYALDEARIEKTKADIGLTEANTKFRLDENERQALKTNMSLREAVVRIGKMREETLLTMARDTNERFRKDVIMQQAEMLRKGLNSKELDTQIKQEELRLKRATPEYYEKALTESVQNILGSFTKPGTLINPKQENRNVDFQRIQVTRKRGTW